MSLNIEDLILSSMMPLETKVENLDLVDALETGITENIVGYVYCGYRFFVEADIADEYRVFELYKNDPYNWLEYESMTFSFFVDGGWEEGLWREVSGSELTDLINGWRTSACKEASHEAWREHKEIS